MRLIHVAIVSSALVLSCQSSPVGPDEGPTTVQIPGVPTEGIELAVGESVELDDGNLRMGFDAVLEDSRCPPDVFCFWEGRARIEITVAEGSDADSVLELVLGGGGRAVRTDGYVLSLLGLTPHPLSTGIPDPEDYRARIRIERVAPPS